MKKMIREAKVAVDGKNIPQGGWKNKPKTGTLECKTCHTWIRHWESFSGKDRPSECSIVGCNSTATEGAHVYNTGHVGTWIVPTCHVCNTGLEHTFELKMGTVLVNPHTHKYGGTIEAQK